MATVVTRPNATVSASGGSRTGGTTTHGVLSDVNVASWVEMWPEAGPARVTGPAPTKPAGSVTKQVRVGVYVSSISVNSTKFDIWLERNGAIISRLDGVQISGTNWQSYLSPWVQPGDLSAAEVAALIGGVRRSMTGAWTNLRAIEMWFETVFAAQPTVTLSQSAAGSTATVSWVPAKGDVDTGEYRWYSLVLKNSGGATVWESGVVDAPTVFSRSVSGLASGSYTWHVQTGHETLPGQGHWTPVTTIATTIPVTTRAQVLSVTATPDPANGAVSVTVNRDTSKDAWGSVEVEAYDPASSTWRPLRNVPTPGTNSVVVYDFEAPPDTSLQYRARAIKTDGVTVGDWVTSTVTTLTIGGGIWLKSATNPNLNVQIRYLAEPPGPTRADVASVTYPLDSALAHVAVGKRRGRVGQFAFITETAEQAAKLAAIVNEPAVLVHTPASWRFPPGWFHFGDLPEGYYSLSADEQWRRWDVDYVEVLAP